MAEHVSAYFEGFAERFAATLWDFGTPGTPSTVEWDDGKPPESKGLAEELLGSGWANKHLDAGLVAEAQAELERLLNKYPGAGFKSMSVIVDQRFGAETNAIGQISIHSSSLTPTGQKASAAKQAGSMKHNGIPINYDHTPKGLVRHEFGHVISQNGGVLQSWYDKNKKALGNLSVYSESSIKEAWAEAFAAHEAGDDRFGVKDFLISRGFDPNRMDWPAEERKLFDVLKKDYIQIGNTAFADVGAMTGRSVVGFGLDSRGSFGTIGKVLGSQVKGITEATRASLSDMIQTGIHNGDHPSVIAKNLMASARGWAGLEDLTKSRAYTIARTETAHAYTWSSIAAYTKSGIVDKVICHDASDCGWIGHNGAELANGTHRTLLEAGQHPTSHPNCVRAFSPAFGDEEPGIRQRAQPQAPAKPGAPAPAKDARLDPKHWANPRNFNTDPNHKRYGRGEAPLEDWGHGMFTKRFAKGNPPPLGPEVLSSYQGAGYRDMNPLLRGEIDKSRGIGNAQYIKDTQTRVDVLTDYINHFETPEAVVVHRGVGSGSAYGLRGLYGDPKEAAARALVGTTHTEQGFMSTALDSEAKFSGVTLELTVPAGYPAVPVSYEATNAISGYEAASTLATMSEAELLLQSGAEYVIDEVIVTPSNLYMGTQDIILKGRILPRK